MRSEDDLTAYYERERALALIRALQEYSMAPPEPAGSAEIYRPINDEINEELYMRSPITHSHVLSHLMRSYIQVLPAQRLQPEASELWDKLVESSLSGFDENTKGNAKALYEWISGDYDIKDRMIFLDGSGPDSNTVVVDGQIYPGVPRQGVELLKILYKNRGKWLNSSTIMKYDKMPKDEKGIRRIIERIPAPLRDMIKSKTSKGRHLELP